MIECHAFATGIIMESKQLSRHLSLDDFCTCTQTYQRFQNRLNPYPTSEDSVVALQELAVYLLDPIIDHFSRDCFALTYGFCSKDLKKHIEKDPFTGERNGRISPELDQHMAAERTKNGKFYCKRRGAACDFCVKGTDSRLVVDWILENELPFDRLYFYGDARPIHLSHGPEQSHYLCIFGEQGQPKKLSKAQWFARSW
ncbi:hypothetical protein L6R29_13585 [Myxococcota bacterium]|nr:hypothetical protein [Myxococcota bacterium]